MDFKGIKEIWKSNCRGDPESAILVYILGAILYEKNETEGEAACSLVLNDNLTIIEQKGKPIRQHIKSEEKRILEILKKNPHIIRSYIKNPDQLTLFLRKKEVARSRAKIFIKSRLKNTPTSLFLIKDEAGYWKIVKGTTSLLRDIK